MGQAREISGDAEACRDMSDDVVGPLPRVPRVLTGPHGSPAGGTPEPAELSETSPPANLPVTSRRVSIDVFRKGIGRRGAVYGMVRPTIPDLTTGLPASFRP